MGRKIPTLGYPSRSEAAKALHKQGLSHHEIAERIGVGESSVGNLLCWQPVGPRRLILPPALARALEPAAEARGVTVPELASRLLERTTAEQLIDAILDDFDDFARAAS